MCKLNCRAIQASLALYQQNQSSAENSSPDSDMEYHMALMLSQQEREQEEHDRLEEQKMLEEVLQLSLREK